MGRKPVLALAGALATTLALAGCSTTSSSHPLAPPNNTIGQNNSKNPAGQPTTSGLAANQNPQNVNGFGNSLPSNQLTGQTNLNASPGLQQNSFNGSIPSPPSPVSVPSRPVGVQQSSNMGMQPGMAPSGLGSSAPVTPVFNGPPAGQSASSFNNVTPTGYTSSQMPNFGGNQAPVNAPMAGRDPSAMNVPTTLQGPNINTSTRVSVPPDMGMPAGPPDMLPTREVPGGTGQLR